MAAPSASSDPRRWHGQQAAPTKTPRSRGKLITVAACAMVLAGAIVALVLWIRPLPEPYFIGIWIDQHSDPHVPFRGWVAQGRDALLALPWKDHDTFNQQERRLLRSALHDLGKYGDQPVVLYLNAYALRDDKGEVLILPGDGHMDDPTTWLPLSEVFEALHQSPSPHKLLILDVMQPLILPEMGLIDRYAAGDISSVLDEAIRNDPKLLILCACSPGQVALELEQEQRSVFAFYLEKGLAGAADGWNEKRKYDGRVSAFELAAFVAARVDRWSRHNSEQPQTPYLLGSHDFALVRAFASAPAETTDAAESEPYPEWLSTGWARIYAWRERPTERVPVSICVGLEDSLLRAQRDWRKGQTVDRLQKVLEGPINAFDKQVKLRKDKNAEATPYSLEETAALGRIPADLLKDETLAKLESLSRIERDAHATKPDPKDVAQWNSERGKFLLEFKDKPVDLAWIVWRAATSEAKPGRDLSRFWGGLLNAAWKDVRAARQPSYPESTFLRRLAEWAENFRGEAWPLETIHDAIAVVLASEQAAAEPDTPAWARLLREPADKNRTDGERLLFATALDEAGSKLRSALGEYNRLNRYYQSLRQARQISDDATFQLLGMSKLAERDSHVLADWTATIRMALIVRRLISDVERLDAQKVPAALRELESQAGELNERVNKLARPFQSDRIKALSMPSRRAGAAELAGIELALSWPGLSSAQRLELWKARCGLAGRLHSETLEDDLRDDTTKTMRSAVAAKPGESERREWSNDALRRARVSVGMLSLMRGKEYQALEDVIDRAAAHPADASTWNEVRRMLIQAWK